MKAAAPNVAAATIAAILGFVISFPPSGEPDVWARLAQRLMVILGGRCEVPV